MLELWMDLTVERLMMTTTPKQKISKTEKETERRMRAVGAVRNIRRKIYIAHGDFPEIDSLIREIRERPAIPYE